MGNQPNKASPVQNNPSRQVLSSEKLVIACLCSEKPALGEYGYHPLYFGGDVPEME
jgi:hypothetical protein